MTTAPFVDQMQSLSNSICGRQRALATWHKILAENKQALSELELCAAIFGQNAPGATSDTKRKLAQETYLRDSIEYANLVTRKNAALETIAKDTAELEHWLRQFRILELQFKSTIAIGA